MRTFGITIFLLASASTAFSLSILQNVNLPITANIPVTVPVTLTANLPVNLPCGCGSPVYDLSPPCGCGGSVFDLMPTCGCGGPVMDVPCGCGGTVGCGGPIIDGSCGCGLSAFNMPYRNSLGCGCGSFKPVMPTCGCLGPPAVPSCGLSPVVDVNCLGPVTTVGLVDVPVLAPTCGCGMALACPTLPPLPPVVGCCGKYLRQVCIPPPFL